MTATLVSPPGADESSNRRAMLLAFGRLLAVFAAVVLACVLTHEVDYLIVILALIVMVMLHELGHFATAKLSGMKVTEYFFGFGPRLWSVRRGETTYGVKALPAGGYVKIVGMTMLETVAEEDEPRSYRQATFPRRLLVAVAGSTTHFLLAFALVWTTLAWQGSVTWVNTAPTVADLVVFHPGPTPAAVAGIRPGDVFVSIDGHATPTYQALAKIVSHSTGRALHVVVRRHGHLLSLTVTPIGRQVCVGNETRPSTVGQIGVDLQTQSARTQHFNIFSAFGETFPTFGSFFSATIGSLGNVFSIHGLRSFGHDVSTAGRATPCVVPGSSSPSSPSSSSSSGSGSGSGQLLSFLGFIQIGTQALQQGVPSLLLLLALVNIFVGVVNLVPMLPLDGGHVLIAVYERVRSRKGRRYHADVMKLLPFAYLFLTFIVIIGLAAVYVNIVQPAQLPGG